MHKDEEEMDLFFHKCTYTRRLDIFVAHFRYITYESSPNKLRQSKEYYVVPLVEINMPYLMLSHVKISLPMTGRSLTSAVYTLMLVDTSNLYQIFIKIYDFVGCPNRHDETLCIDIFGIFKFQSFHVGFKVFT